MGRVGSGRLVVGVNLPAEIVKAIDRRAALLPNVKRSTYAAWVLKWWHENGQPSVCPAESVIRAARENGKSDERPQ